MITTEQFHSLFPNATTPDLWAAAINATCPRYGINTPRRLAMFLGQVGHESGGFTALVENLNYSSDGLMRTWPKRFPQSMAEKYARQPQLIANRAYADRMGNGPEQSGDGWRYRGRGLIQLTGKSNYSIFAKLIDRDMDATIAYLETPEGALESACWYWRLHNLNASADAEDFVNATATINGGLIGLQHRKAIYAKATNMLSATPAVA